MKTKGLIAAVLTVALSSNWTFAQDDEEGDESDLDVTITVMPQGADLPDVVTGEITLPTDEEGSPIPADEGVENSADGLSTANQAREDGRAFGEAAAAAAEANREDAGRGSRPNLEDLVPGDPPVPEDLPELPDPPVDVPGPPGG